MSFEPPPDLEKYGECTRCRNATLVEKLAGGYCPDCVPHVSPKQLSRPLPGVDELALFRLRRKHESGE